MSLKRVYVVVEQGRPLPIDYAQELCIEAEIIYIYCHNVYVSTTLIEKLCQFFSKEELPDTITSRKEYDDRALQMARMMQEVLEDPQNRLIVWTFPLNVDYMGAYRTFVESLSKRNKKLLFFLSSEEMEALLPFHIHTDPFVKAGVLEIKERNTA